MICGWPAQSSERLPILPMIRSILFFTLFLSGAVFAADIQVSSDRHSVHQDEAFVLTYSAHETPDADPDFSVLEQDFEILSQSQNKQVSLNGGRYQETSEWVLSLVARQAGIRVIPPVAFGSDHSSAMSITVLAAAPASLPGDDEVFMEVTVDPPEPYVQAQALYTVRLFSQTGFNGGGLSEPTAEDVLIQRLGDDRPYTTQRQGRHFEVIERRYAVFPQKSGPLTIGSLILTTRVPVRNHGAIVNPFLGSRLQLKRLQSEPVTLAVKPVPTAFGNHPWLPAEQVVLQESWSGQLDNLKAGEPVTRTLTLTAKAATIGMLPELMTSEVSPDQDKDIRWYADQPVLNEEKLSSGIISIRHQKIAYVPSHAGSMTVPALDVHWWNTRTQQHEVAHLPAHTLTVKGTVVATAAPSSSPSADAVPVSLPVPAAVAGELPYLWVGLTSFFALAWGLTLLFWWKARQPGHTKVTGNPPESPDAGRALASLRRACQNDDAIAARHALLAWTGLQWPDAPGTQLDALARMAGHPLDQELEHLNRTLYGGHPVAVWQGKDLWLYFETYLKQQHKVSRTRQDRGLAPLYPGTD